MNIINDIKKPNAIMYINISAMEKAAKEKVLDKKSIADMENLEYAPFVNLGKFFAIRTSITVSKTKLNATTSILKVFVFFDFSTYLLFVFLFITTLSAIGTATTGFTGAASLFPVLYKIPYYKIHYCSNNRYYNIINQFHIIIPITGLSGRKSRIPHKHHLFEVILQGT